MSDAAFQQLQINAVRELTAQVEVLCKVTAAAAIVQAQVLRTNSLPSTTPRKELLPKESIEDAMQILEDNIDNQ